MQYNSTMKNNAAIENIISKSKKIFKIKKNTKETKLFLEFPWWQSYKMQTCHH